MVPIDSSSDHDVDDIVVFQAWEVFNFNSFFHLFCKRKFASHDQELKKNQFSNSTTWISHSCRAREGHLKLRVQSLKFCKNFSKLKQKIFLPGHRLDTQKH